MTSISQPRSKPKYHSIQTGIRLELKRFGEFKSPVELWSISPWNVKARGLATFYQQAHTLDMRSHREHIHMLFNDRIKLSLNGIT